MGRLFVTGDTHSTIDWEKLNTKNWEEQRNLTRDDHLLIAGDFGAQYPIVTYKGAKCHQLRAHEFHAMYERILEV